MLVAHPKNLNTDREPRPPIGYDVADSTAFANKPSLGFTIHPTKRDEMDVIELRTWKVRDSQLYGFHKGRVDLGFDTVHMSYHSMPTPFRSMAA